MKRKSLLLMTIALSVALIALAVPALAGAPVDASGIWQSGDVGKRLKSRWDVRLGRQVGYSQRFGGTAKLARARNLLGTRRPRAGQWGNIDYAGNVHFDPG